MHSTVTKPSILYPYNCKNVDRLSNRSKTYQFHTLWRPSLCALLGLYIKHNAAGTSTLSGRHNIRGLMLNAHSLCFPAFCRGHIIDRLRYHGIISVAPVLLACLASGAMS
jgi:hypothetical protein